MRILLSNDDGYFAPGLAALAEALQDIGEVVVVAPEQNRSGASNSLTLDRPLLLKKAAVLSDISFRYSILSSLNSYGYFKRSFPGAIFFFEHSNKPVLLSVYLRGCPSFVPYSRS